MTNKKINDVVGWIKKKVELAGAKGVVVGLSGGIDSAVCAVLAKRALPNNTLCVILPCFSSEADMEDAYLVSRELTLETIESDLSIYHKKMMDEIKVLLSRQAETNFELSAANLKARLRMSTLYAIANALNYMVIGTDNAAEYYTGYFTKYGDGGVDLLPIGTLQKREVKEWASLLGVPERIINKPPSAGLWEGQLDEEEMGTNYEMIDDFLAGKDIPQSDKELIEKMHKQSEHKRRTPPIFPE